ncbi:MAG: glycosyltransferase family 4 protein [Rhodobacteraceae bacterium]|nr:glycosyltransferase family 4 protein [Paracoccaceae bacterium]
MSDFDDKDQLSWGLGKAARYLARAGPDFDAHPLLEQALANAKSSDALLWVAEVALELVDTKVFAAACAKLALEQDGTSTRLDQLKVRADTMLGITDIPPPVDPLGGAVVKGRVAYVLYSSLPWLSTGYAIRSHHLAQALRRAGSDVHCLTRPGFPWDEDPKVLAYPMPPEESSTENIEGLHYIRSPSPQFGNWHNYQTYIRESADTLTKQFRALRPEIVVAASSHACALPALLAARRLGLPMAYDMRGFWELSRASREPAFLGSGQYCYERYLETEVARQADHVFTLSRPMAVSLVGRGVGTDKISHLPNGCDPSLYGPVGRGDGLRLRLGLPTTVPVIGYAGSFAAYEGLEDLLVSAATLRRLGCVFRLLLVGDENGTGLSGQPVTERLRHQARAAGLEDWLVMPGRVPPSDIPDYLDVIDIAVFPRRPLPVTEVVGPLKPVEAMAASKAIVVSSVAGMAGIVSDGETGLIFKKGDTADLTRQLERLVTDPYLRKRLGLAARANAENNLSWDHVAGQMLMHLSALTG